MSQTTDITIRLFQPDDAEAFRTLNEAWITRFFALEDSDRKVLGDPQGAIIDKGGQILMAIAGHQAVGAVALQRVDAATLELAKMTVSETLRGTGLGRRLMDAAIAQARVMQAKTLYLESNTSLKPAISLYEAVGFRVLAEEEGGASPYARCNIRMELVLA